MKKSIVCFLTSRCCFATVKLQYNEFQRGRLLLNDSFWVPNKKNDCYRKRILILFGTWVKRTATLLSETFKQLQILVWKQLTLFYTNLTSAQEEARVRWWRSTLDRFDDGSPNLMYIITCHETWVYCCDPEKSNNRMFRCLGMTRFLQYLFVKKA